MEEWPVNSLGQEMRGGLRDGHAHMAYVSRPVIKGQYPGARGTCPACVEWAKELEESSETSRFSDMLYGSCKACGLRGNIVELVVHECPARSPEKENTTDDG